MKGFSLQDWLQVAYLLGAVQGTFLAAVLAGGRRRSTANRLLALAMLVFSIDLSMAVYHESGAASSFPYLIGLDFPLAFLYGPLIYLYARALTGSVDPTSARTLAHFLPFAFVSVFTLAFFAQPPDIRLDVLGQTTSNVYSETFELVNPTKILHGISYVVATFGVLRVQRRRLKDEPSHIERLSLAWLRNLTIGIISLTTIAAVLYVANLRNGGPVLGMDPGRLYDDLTLLSVTIFVYAVGYLGLRQPEVFHPRSLEDRGLNKKEKKEKVYPGPRYAKSAVHASIARQHLRSLLTLMDDRKLYREGDLTLHDLANALQVTPHHLTQVLNTLVGKSFHDFVNGYRVEEVRERLQDPDFQHWTILAIGFEAGFNSKSSFYAVFKKHTGQTPSEYRRSSAISSEH